MADLEEGLELIGSAVAVTEKTTPKAAVVWGTVDQITPSIKVILDGDIDSESREVSDNAAGPLEVGWRVKLSYQDTRLVIDSAPQQVVTLAEDILQVSLDAEAAAILAQASMDEAIAVGARVDTAQSDADAALLATGGASAVITASTSPAPPATRRNGTPLQVGDLWYVLNASGRITGVNIWTGTSWVTRTLVADSVLVPSSLGTISLADGAITAPKISTGALDFKTATGMELFSGTITGALIQTEAAANRGIKITTGGFVAYDNSGAVTATINAAGGAFTGYTISGGTITGALIQTDSAAGVGLKLRTSGLELFDDGVTDKGVVQFYLYGDPRIRVSGSGMEFWHNDVISSNIDGNGGGLDLWSKYWVSADAPEVDFSGNLFNVTNSEIRLDSSGGNQAPTGTLKFTTGTWTTYFDTLSFLNTHDSGLTVSGLGTARLIGPKARVEVGTDVILRTENSLYIRKNTSNVSPLTPSYWQAASPLMLDENGRVYQWANAPQRPVTASSAFPSGTTWAAGQVRIWTASYSATSPSGNIRDVLVNFTNFPGGSANLNIRRGAFSATSCTVYVVNTGTTSTTLGGDLGVQVSVLV